MHGYVILRHYYTEA